MTVYELTTNFGKYIVRCRPTKEQEFRYIRAMRAKGYRLSEIMFCHGPIHVSHTPEFVVAQAERDALELLELQNGNNSAQQSFFLMKLGANQ